MTVFAPLASPTQAMVDYLAPLVDPVAVGVYYPNTSTPENPARPFVQVALDGSPSITRVSVTVGSTIRVTVWSDQPDDAETLAWRVLAYVEGYPGGVKAWRMKPLTGPLSGRDPDTQAFLCSITARVSPRPTAA